MWIRQGSSIRVAALMLLFSISISFAAIAPPSPAAMQPYSRGDVAFNGDMSFSIPLMDVPATGGLSFPIVAHYQTGIRVDDAPGPIGIGWNLETGSVRRIQMGPAVDFHDISEIDPTFNAYDPVPDAFYVTFPTGGMKFFNYGTVSAPNFQPESANSPMRLEIIDFNCLLPKQGGGSFDNACDYTGFVLTLSDGTKYVYNYPLKESVSDRYDNGDEFRTSSPAFGSYKGNMEWKLTAILSSDYQENPPGVEPIDYDPLNSQSTNLGSWIALTYSKYVRHYQFEGPSSPIFHKEFAYPLFIQSKTARAVFNLQFMEKQYDYQMWPYEINPASDSEGDNSIEEQNYRYQSVDLYNAFSGGSKIKSVSFEFNTDNGITTTSEEYSPVSCLSAGITGYPLNTPMSRLMLTKITTYGYNSAILPPYEFKYFAGPTTVDGRPSCSRASPFNKRDIFGYYTTNPDGLDIAFESNGIPKTDDAKVWSLNQIRYPTGTTYSYDFENDVLYQDFDLDGPGGIFSDSTNHIYKMGGIRLKSTSITVANDKTYIYSQEYLTPDGPLPDAAGGVGVISKIPQNYVQIKLASAGYGYLPSFSSDIGEFVFYGKTKLVLPGSAGHVISYFFEGSGIENYYDQSQLISASSICYKNNNDFSNTLCPSHGETYVGMLPPDEYDGLIGFPVMTKYYANGGSSDGTTTAGLVKMDETIRSPTYTKVFEQSPSVVGPAGFLTERLFWKKLDLPTKSISRVYDPSDPSKYMATSTSYTYSDFASEYPTVTNMNVFLPTSASTCKVNAANSCIGAVRTTSTIYAFQNDVNNPNKDIANFRDTVKKKFMLTLPAYVESPKGKAKTTYKILAS